MSADRVITLLLIATLGYLVARACRRWPERRRNRLGRVLALGLAAYAATFYIQKGVAGELNVAYNLPLELCDWVMVACFIALLRPNRLASEIAYFWGLAGTLPAVITPDIGSGFPSWGFLLFFWGHGGVLLAVVYLMAGQGFRPGPGSGLRALIALHAYALVAGGVDLAFGWNYGFLCAKPLAHTLMDFLGPWPWYLVSIEAIAIVGFTLLSLPWRMVRQDPPPP